MRKQKDGDDMNIEEIKDLTKEYKYKIETHAHTNPASPCSQVSPENVVKLYKQADFDAVVITNHFIDYLLKGTPKEITNTYLKDYYDAKNAGEKYGIRVILGMEIRFPDTPNDYLVYGIEESEIEKIYSFINTDYISFYKQFKTDKNLILQAHPFRKDMVLQNPDYLDGIEVFNVHPHHNSRIALANKYAKEHPHFVITCGTDFHDEGYEGLGGILSKKLPENSLELAELLKSCDYLYNIAGSIILP